MSSKFVQADALRSSTTRGALKIGEVVRGKSNHFGERAKWTQAWITASAFNLREHHHRGADANS